MQGKRMRVLAAFLSAAIVCSAIPFPGGNVSAEENKNRGYKEEILTASSAPEETDQTDGKILLDGYVWQLLGLNSGISLLGNWGEVILNEREKLIYNQLKESIAAIAAEGGSTVIELTEGNSWTFTYEELGYDGAQGGVTDEMEEIISQKLNISFDKIMDALLVDCPYELYWYDKTAGISRGILYRWNSTSVTYMIPQITFKVSEDYKENGSQTSVDGSKALSAAAAAEKAQEIVEKYQDASDYDKLVGYKNEICSLTSYDNKAADDSATPYGDPWQLIYIFDGIESTNVVCEGYAKAFQYLCDLTEFDNPSVVCYTVSGIMAGGTGAGGHMWNIVSMPDGKNYLVDVTNSDTGTAGQFGDLFLAGTEGSVEQGYVFVMGLNRVSYTYYDDTKSLYGSGDDSILKLASEDYDPDTAAVLLSASVSSSEADYGTSFVVNVKGDPSKSVEIYLGSRKIADSAALTGGSADITVNTLTAGLAPAALADQTGSYEKDYNLTVKYTDGSESEEVRITVDYAEISASAQPQQTASKEGWYNTPLQINAPAGYTIARMSGEAMPDADTAWNKSFSMDGEGSGIAVVYYLRSAATGAIGRNSSSYSIDQTPPEKLNAQISAITDTSATVTLSAQDVLSGIRGYKLKYKSGGSAEPTVADTGNGVFTVTGLEPRTSYVFTASAADQADNTAEEIQVNLETAGKLSISDAEVKVSGSYVYTGEQAEVGKDDVTVILNGIIVSPEDYDVSFGDDLINAGTVNVTVTAKEDSDDYTGTASGTFEIARKKLKITADDQTIIYGEDISRDVTEDVSTEGLVSGDELMSLEWSADVSAVTASGSIDIKDAVIKNSSGSQVTDNYDVTYGSGSLIIKKATADISFNESYNPSKDYDGRIIANPSAEDLKITGARYQDVIFTWYKGSVSALNRLENAPSDAGTYILTASVAETDNTTAASDQIEVTIRTVTIPADQVEFRTPEKLYVYDGTAKKPEVTVWADPEKTIKLPENTYKVTYTDNVNANKNSLVTVEIAEGNRNYAFDGEIIYSFTILPADPDVGDITYQGGTLYTSTSWEDVELTRSGTTPGIISLDQTVFEAGTREYSWTFIPQDTENYKTAAGRITLTVQTVEAERLEVRGTPVKTEYVYGDTFAPEGTVFTVHYTDGSSRTLQLSEIKFIYENGAFFCAGDTSVTVSSTVNGKVLEAIVEGLTVSPKTVTDPRIVLAVPTEGYVYDETEKEPAVTVYDGDELIPDTEYTVEYSDNLLAGKAEAVIRDNEGGNYAVSGKATFEIAKADQLPLNIYGMPEGNISYRDTFQLSAAGGSGTSELTWKVTSGNEYAVITADGTVTVTGIGDVEITVTKAGDDNYNETSSSWKFSTGKAVPEVGEVTYSGGQLYTTDDPADVKLDMTGKVSGTVALAEGTVFAAGVQEYVWIFTPEDTEHYNSVSGVTELDIMQDKPAEIILGGSLDQTDYSYGDLVDLSGLTATVRYISGYEEVLDTGCLTVIYRNGAFLGTGDTGVKVSFTSADVTVSADVMGLNISAKTVNDPVIVLEKNRYIYDGTAKLPGVTVKDGETIIPDGEYIVTYADNVGVGMASVTVSDREGGNYVIAEKTVTFEITEPQIQADPDAGKEEGEDPDSGEREPSGQTLPPQKAEGNQSAEIEEAVRTGDAGGFMIWIAATAVSGVSVIYILNRKRMNQ